MISLLIERKMNIKTKSIPCMNKNIHAVSNWWEETPTWPCKLFSCFISCESQLIEKRRVEFILSPWYSINVIYVSDFTLWHVNFLALNLIVEKRNQFIPWLRSSDYESSFLVSHYNSTKCSRISVGGIILIWKVP